MDKGKPIKIAILASGNGSNFEAIVGATKRGQLTAEVVGVISNREDALVIERAARLGIPRAVFPRKSFDTLDTWNQALLNQLIQWRCEWVVLAGFTGLIGKALLDHFESHIVNSHPSLLPKYGGKGMYGLRVHAAVIAGGETESGITVHLLNEHFDEGPIVAQLRVPVHAGDTAQSLAERIKSEERRFYPQVLQELVTGRIKR